MGLLTKHCPHCGTLINYSDKDETVCCLACDRKFSVGELRETLDSNSLEATLGTTSVADPALVSTIETSESGLAYLDNFFDNYDWEEYYTTTRITIPAITSMVEKNKVKNAANPSTWVLEFRSIAHLVAKKIEGLKVLEQNIVDNYDPVDNTNVYMHFDAYAKVTSTLLGSKEVILRTLNNDIRFAEKYGGKEEAKALKAELAKLEAAFEAVKEVKALEDVEAVAKLVAEQEQVVINELAEQGIDARSIYEEAVSRFHSDADKSYCLKLFLSVRKFKDAERYIRSINRLYNFNGKLYDISGRTYITKRNTIQPLPVDVKGKGKAKAPAEGAANPEDQDLSNTFGLYEVIDGVPAEKAVLTGISAIYCVYGTSVFFVKNDKQLCSFNIVTKETTKLDQGSSRCYMNRAGKYEYYLSKDQDVMFLKKVLTAKMSKVGCFGKLFGKKSEVIENRNNFALVAVDLKENKFSTLVEELVDIEFVNQDKIFYTYVENQKDEYETFMVYDLAKRSAEKVLEYGCHIHKVVGEKVIYSELNPSSYNLDLYVYDLETKESLLLEHNVYDYFDLIDNKVYYTVGNEDYCPLFSINLDGSERTEIMQNVENICLVRAGWMYVIKRWRQNLLLMKISVDGKKRVVITTRLHKFIKFENGYVYYLDGNDDLHIVRNDGKEDRVIAEGVEPEGIVIDKGVVYFTRYEQVSSNKSSLSIYTMDLDGHNLRKLVFNIDDMAEYDENTIYFERHEYCKFEFTTPVSKKETKKSYRYCTLDRFYALDKATGTTKVVLTLGLPKTSKLDFKGGCLGKKTTSLEETCVEVPVRHKYERANKIQAGSTYNTQVNENNAAAGANKTNANQLGCLAQNNTGKNGKAAANNQGCGCLNQKPANKKAARKSSTPGCGCAPKK